MKNKYYVYVYNDPSKPGDFIYDEYHFHYEPFYVGKGHGGRNNVHLKGKSHNKELISRINLIKENVGIEPVVVNVWENLYEDAALDIERKLILKIGTIYSRKNKGPLLNKAYSNTYTEYIEWCNPAKQLYILKHPYVSNDEIFTNRKNVRLFCEKKHMNYYEFIEGKCIDGWTLTIV